MRYRRLLCVLLFMSLSAAAIAGDIQVTCGPGIRIYLDGKFMGTTNAKEGGLVLPNVADGPHTVGAQKFGFAPQNYQVRVSTTPIEIKVGQFSPETAGRGEIGFPATTVAETVGDLTVTSVPQNCTVSIDGKSREKDTPTLSLGALTRGRHDFTFSREGYASVSGVVEVQPGSDITVRGDLIDGKVETIYEGIGSLRVYSTPAVVKVRILGQVRDKIDQVLNMSYLPAGQHTLVVEWKGRQLSRTILITNRHRTIVTVSFMPNGVPFSVSYEPE